MKTDVLSKNTRQPHVLAVAHDFLSTQQLCTMATACTVPVTETFGLLHGRRKCLDARRKVPETVVHQVMPMAHTGIQPRNWPRMRSFAKPVWSNVRKWTWIAPLQTSSRKQFVKLRIRARNLGQHSIASQALRNVFMTMWFQSGQTVREHIYWKTNANTFGKKTNVVCVRSVIKATTPWPVVKDVMCWSTSTNKFVLGAVNNQSTHSKFTHLSRQVAWPWPMATPQKRLSPPT